MRNVNIDGLSFKATLIGANPENGRVLLQVNDQVALKALAESDEPPLIGEDGVAVSPLEKFPGEIRFPAAPGGKQFRAVYNAVKRQPDDPDVPGRPVIPYWRAVAAVALEVCVQTPDGKMVTAGTDVDDVPSPVLDWVSLCLQEYDANFLRSGL